jgi:5'-nucleotidase
VHRMFRDMPAIDGASEALWRLSDAGVWIRIVTHRLYANWGHAVAVADTVEWLDAAGIPYRDLCFLGRKPAVEADLYVEDAPHNVAELREAGNRVVVYDQPYNRDLEGPRARSWAEVEAIVAELRSPQRGRPAADG